MIPIPRITQRLGAAVLLGLLAIPAAAGFLDNLKNAAEEKAREAAREAVQKPGAAEQPEPAPEQPPAEPATDAENPQPAPAAESEPAEPPPPARPLPPAETVSIVLCRSLEGGTQDPVDVATEFPAYGDVLFASVTITDGQSYGLTGRIIAENVPGTERDAVVCRGQSDGWIDGEIRRASLMFSPLPDGLPEGSYRLEAFENNPPGRVVAAAKFTTQLAPPIPADRFVLTVSEQPDSSGDNNPAREISSRAGLLHLTVEARDAMTLDFSTRLIVENVPGSKPGRLIRQLPADPNRGFSPGTSQVKFPLDLPRSGLLPGRYAVEIVEGTPPFRTLKRTTFTTSDGVDSSAFNLANPEFGGLLESASAEGGAGLSWAWMLLRENSLRPWPTINSPTGTEGITAPCELVLSFFRREIAMVSSVEIVCETPGTGPSNVEVWGSMVNAREGFQQLASRKFDTQEQKLTVPVPSSFVRFLKVRFVAGPVDGSPLVITGVRVIEGTGAGYQPLSQRLPEVRDWRMQPRHAAQQGLFYLQASATDFQRDSQCMGCHVQSQALMGLSVARKNDYIVSDSAERFLAEFTLRCQTSDGGINRVLGEGQSPELTTTVFSALGLAFAHPTPESVRGLLSSATWLASRQDPEGMVSPDSVHAPVTEGEILHTSHSMDIWAEALALGGDASLQQNISRGLAWIQQAPAANTQDRVFKVLAFTRHGGPEEKKLARQLCQQLLTEQAPEGSWKVMPDENEPAPGPFATGQVLYALRQAGFSPKLPSFQRGVRWLLEAQEGNGSWMGSDTETPFAATMWPVIALTGSFSSKAEPARLSVTALPRPVPPPPPPPPPKVISKAPTLPKTILFVLDCSFSMSEKVNRRPKIDTAKQVMRDVITRLPDDSRVGLRLYGHRFDSMTAPSTTDTQLVIPIGPLNRPALLKVIDGAETRGQTPLVLSTLKAGDDLKRAGGGILIVVTDGEESCGGKPRKAGPLLAGLGVPLRLDVIGFAIKGKRVVEEMTAFTAPTGGRYYTAADGPQLAAALSAAVSPTPVVVVAAAPPPPPPPEPLDLPYEVFDAKGKAVARGTTMSGEQPELPAGSYRIVLRDGEKTVVLENVTLAETETTEVRYDPVAGRIDRL